MSGKVKKFEDLHIWQESMQLSIELYQELQGCANFGLKDQIQRSAVSIPSNIAEGFDRESNKEFIRFLYISKGSTGELRTQLYLCKKLGVITDNNCDTYIEKTKKISAMLHNLIQTRKADFS